MQIKDFRSSFINLQNKVDFQNSGKTLVNLFKDIVFETEQSLDSFIECFASKKKVIIVWKTNEDSKMIIMNKDSENYVEDFDSKLFNDERFLMNHRYQHCSVHNPEFINTLKNLFSDLFTGRNWYSLN